MHLLVGHGRQTGEHVAQVLPRVEATAAASFDEGEEDRAALAHGFVADEQPVLLAHGGGPDGVLHKVVVDLDSSVLDVRLKHGP